MKKACTLPLPNTFVNPHMNEISFIYGMLKGAVQLKEKYHAALEPLGIHPVHFILLYMIDMKKSLSQKDLGAELGIDKASIVKFLDDLEGFKFIQRTEDAFDRRIKLITVTPAAQKVIKKAQAIQEKVEAEYLANKLTSEESKTLRRLVRKLMTP